MIESIKNKANADQQRENGITVYPTEEVLGSMKQVKDFAAFYAVHKQDFAQISGHFLLDYCNSMSFTPEKLEAFKLGLSCLQGFFEASESDTKMYLMQAERKNKPIG